MYLNIYNVKSSILISLKIKLYTFFFALMLKYTCISAMIILELYKILLHTNSQEKINDHKLISKKIK